MSNCLRLRLRAVAYQSELYEIYHMQSCVILDVLAGVLPVDSLNMCGMEDDERERVDFAEYFASL